MLGLVVLIIWIIVSSIFKISFKASLLAGILGFLLSSLLSLFNHPGLAYHLIDYSYAFAVAGMLLYVNELPKK